MLNKRSDDRGLMEFRDVSLNLSAIHTADGSATVKIGNTAVICGIKAVSICFFENSFFVYF